MIKPTEEESRFASAQLASGCDALEQQLQGLLEESETVAQQVHALRKLGKSLRGGFCLFRLGKAPVKEIQAIGRLLSGSRDAVSRLNTWNKLSWHEDPAAASAIAGLLEQQTKSASIQPRQETLSWCLERAKAAKEHLGHIPENNLSERIADGLGRLQKRVIKRARRLDLDSEEAFHDLRKALKAYLGALAFLPATVGEKHPVMAKMAELLGDENDLSTLCEWLKAHGFTEDFVPGLWKALKKARLKLRKRLMRDAETLYTAKGAVRPD